MMGELKCAIGILAAYGFVIWLISCTGACW